jgi:predicted TIM-barrel fold metal-dependent hydrolase
VPVLFQAGHSAEFMPSACGKPILLDDIAIWFPELDLVGAHTGWPWVEELISVCYKWENVWLGIDAWMPKYLKPEVIQFIGSRMGQDRCLWGTNGLPWKESLDQVEQLGLKPEAKRKLIRDNAVQLFKL